MMVAFTTKEQFDQYKKSYLFRLMRSYKDNNETTERYVLKAYAGTQSRANNSSILSPQQNKVAPKSADTSFDKAKENRKQKTSVAQPKEPDTFTKDDAKRKNEVLASPAPQTHTEVITIPKPATLRRAEPNKQAKIQTINTDSIIQQTQPVTKITDLNKTFKAAEWLIANNRESMYLENQFNNMVVKKIFLTSIEDNSENYIPLDRKTFHLLRTLIIGNDTELYFIFNDSNYLSIAPKHWLDSDVDIKTLKKNNYKYVYHDLDLQQLLNDLKPFIADKVNGEVSGQKYMQLWFKYIPIAPAK